MRIVDADEVRAAIAWHMLGGVREERQLGRVTLHHHQWEGAGRLRRMIALHGGALLADDVGLGKTFIALAVARAFRAPLVIAPASLRPVWSRALEDTALRAEFCSFEMLSRGRRPSGTHDLVVIDEAHHLRSRRTRRFDAAVALCTRARVLLATATPVQNRTEDLRTVLSLFLGERAFAAPADELSTYIVRRRERDVASHALALPTVNAPRWLPNVDDADCLDQLLALPPPVPPSDGDDGGVLLTYTLARQWSSSRSALRATLRRRLAAAAAMEDALMAGRRPSGAELRAWTYADGAQQLAFPELIAAGAACHAPALLSQVRRHASAVRDLLRRLLQSPDPDDQRAAVIQEVQRRHPAERVVCFSEYATTVTALFERLRAGTRCAMLTHAGGRVASGPISRAEVVARFGPDAPSPGERDRIDVLLSTDVLSEGVSLHGASVLVHLDVPWNPARLEQRVGRLRRLGASHASVTVYMMPAPAATERLLDMEGRLRAKLDVAARSVGIEGTIVPGFSPHASSASASREALLRLLRPWPSRRADHPVASAVRARVAGAIACVARPGTARLLVSGAHGVSDATDDVLAMLRHASGEPLAADPGPVGVALAVFEHWLRHEAVSHVVDLAALRMARSRRIVLRRVDGIARRAPRHVQPTLAPLVNAARAAATATLSTGAERILEVLARARIDDEAWLRAVGEFAAFHVRDGSARDTIVALLLLVPDPAC